MARYNPKNKQHRKSLAKRVVKMLVGAGFSLDTSSKGEAVFERAVAKGPGELLSFGAHVVTHDHRGLALAGNEAGEGTADRLGAIGGELVRHRATHVVGLEDGIEIGHRSGSVSGVTRGLRSSASSDLPIIGRPTSFGSAFAASCG